MFFKNLKLTFRYLLKHRNITLINIIGFSISLACAFFILLWVENELSYDKFHPDYKQLYRVEENQYYSNDEPYHVNVTPHPAGPVWEEEIPEIIGQCRMAFSGGVLFNYEDKKYFENSIMAVDSSFFQLFGYKLIMGDANYILNEPQTMAMSESTAKKYFGDENPIGKSVKIDNDEFYTVTGVFKDPPKTSEFSMDILLPWSYRKQQSYYSDSWNTNAIGTVVKVQEGSVDSVVNRKITEVTNLHKPDNTIDFEIASLHKMHLHSYFGYGHSPGAIIYIYIFSAIALFVLIIACINFMNLSTSKASLRAKEIGLRKVNGATRLQIIRQHLMESFIQTAISMVLAVIIVVSLLDKFNYIADKEIVIHQIFTLKYTLYLLGVLIFTGLLAGSYPAFYLSSFNPSRAIKDTQDSKSGSGILRKVLVVFQFSIAVVLIAGAMIIERQLEYMRNADLGFEKEHLLSIPLTGGLNTHYKTLKTELDKVPGVESISATQDSPHNIGSNSSNIEWQGKDPDAQILVSFTAVDMGYTNTMGIDILAGRSFSEDFPGDLYHDDTLANYLINNTLADIIGKEEIVGMDLSFMGIKGKVVGVMDDFNFSPLRDEMEPLAIIPVNPLYLMNMMVRVNSENITGTIQDIENVWNDLLPQYPFSYSFVDDEIDKMYKSEARMSTLIRLFTLVAIIISCLGLFALASFSAERRMREIGIRKSFGAQDTQILYIMVRDFSWFILVSIVIALPFTWLLATRWLQEFAYRIKLNPDLFIIATLITVAVSILTVSYQAIRASRLNPVDSLHYE